MDVRPVRLQTATFPKAQSPRLSGCSHTCPIPSDALNQRGIIVVVIRHVGSSAAQVTRLTVEDSIERRIEALQNAKMGVASDVLRDQNLDVGLGEAADEQEDARQLSKTLTTRV